MRNFRLWGGAAIVVAVIAAGVWALWSFELRWRPATVTRHQAEIAQLLQRAGWVSPGVAGRPIYMVTHGACADCKRAQTDLLADLRSAGIDTRVIAVARRDENGRALSTPAERATVAQLWLTRDWRLLQAWLGAPAGAWTGAGLPVTDGDMARTAVVEAGRSTVDRLRPLLADNGLTFDYPLLIWWNAAGEMRACACEGDGTWRFIRRELGA